MNIIINAAIRKDRMSAGVVPVVIRVMADRKVLKTLPTGIKIKPEHWDEVNRIVKRGNPNASLYNEKILRETTRLSTEFMKKERNSKLTSTVVKKIAAGKDHGTDFIKFCEGWGVEKYKNPATLKAFNNEMAKLKMFRTEIDFADVDFSFLTNYKKFLEARANKPNTIWKAFKTINTMLLDARKMKVHFGENPFHEFDRGSYKNPDKYWLDIHHCDKIEEKCLKDDVAVVIRRVALKFLLMCYSGLRFADAMTFDPNKHIKDGRLTMVTQKGGVPLQLKLYDRLSRVVEMIKEQPLPKMGNHQFNIHLKSVASVAGISDVNLTCHVGRHTFGGLLAELEIPQEQAQKMMAHKQIQSTRIYYHLKDKNMDAAADKLNKL